MISNSNSLWRGSGMPIQVDGVRVHAMSGTELSRVRTELHQLCVFPAVAPHPVQPHSESSGHGHLGDVAFHPHSHASRSRLQIPIELLCFSLTVVQSPFTSLSCLGVSKRDVLIARVIIHAYNQHVRLLSPEPLVFDKPSLLGSQEPALLCNQVKFALSRLSGNATNQELGGRVIKPPSP